MSYAFPVSSSSDQSSPSDPDDPHQAHTSFSTSASSVTHDPPSAPTSIPDISSSTAPREAESPASPITSPGAWLSYPVNYAVSSLYRRVSAPADPRLTGLLQAPERASLKSRYGSTRRSEPDAANSMWSRSSSRSRKNVPLHSSVAPPLPGQGSQVFQPPSRTASPFQPPPLTALTLKGLKSNTSEEALILSRALAEEIRLLVPPRLQLVADWTLAYSVDQDGASLATLYSKCEKFAEGRMRAGFVLVVRDGAGGTFGAFLTDAPRPSSHYYGTGESFLWSASIQSLEQMLSHLPPPPSEDTTHMEGRSTTLLSPTRASFSEESGMTKGSGNGHLAPDMSRASTVSKAPTEEERIRFKAFPYSGVNDYMIYCEHSYLSVGGGDGKYGLWLDDRLEQGISSHSQTFGNEPLSEEGEKFEAMGVEVWFVGG